MSAKKPILWAHRGASAQVLGNTTEAFRKAVELGADGFELDVQLTRDDVPVVMHDDVVWVAGRQILEVASFEPLMRFRDDPLSGLRALQSAGAGVLAHWDAAGAAGAWRRIADVTWLELKEFTRWDPLTDAEHKVPSLEQVLAEFSAPTLVDIELKGRFNQHANLVPAVSDIVRKQQAEARVFLSAFDHRFLPAMAQELPASRLLAIVHARPRDYPYLVQDIPNAAIDNELEYLDEDSVRSMVDAGVDVHIGGLQSVDDVGMVTRWGAAGYFLDDPKIARTA